MKDVKVWKTGQHLPKKIAMTSPEWWIAGSWRTPQYQEGNTCIQSTNNRGLQDILTYLVVPLLFDLSQQFFSVVFAVCCPHNTFWIPWIKHDKLQNPRTQRMCWEYQWKSSINSGFSSMSCLTLYTGYSIMIPWYTSWSHYIPWYAHSSYVPLMLFI